MARINLFAINSKSTYVYLLLLGILKSVLATSVLYFINRKIEGDTSVFILKPDVLVFVLLLLMSFIFGWLFQNRVITLSRDIAHSLSLSIIKRISTCSLKTMEGLGKERIYTAMGDAQTVSDMPKDIVEVFNSVVIIAACSAYLIYIVPLVGIAIIGIMGLVLLAYITWNNVIGNSLNYLRDLADHNFRYLNDLILGFRQLKNNESRRIKLLRHLELNFESIRQLRLEVAQKYLSNYLWGTYSWYLIIGLLLYLPIGWTGMTTEQSLIFIVTVLYLIGPVTSLINFYPTYTSAKIAIERLQQVEDELCSDENLSFAAIQRQPYRTFDTITFKGIEYRYSETGSDKKGNFVIGPVNLHIQKGSIVFIVGGNGSGKTTFLKILAGLYVAPKGDIFINGEKLTDTVDYMNFANQFSVIFSDNHIFSENYDDHDFSEDNAKFVNYVSKLRLEKLKELIDDNKIRGHELSRGEQKRFAMILSLLEGKEIIVLDEWAAEQDPEFKKYFYTELLPSFQKLGKTVIAVTHDDEYFSVADSVLKFDFGKTKNVELQNYYRGKN